jgi:hypothetical protein
LYVGSTAYGCYLETLARFRPDLSFYAELAQIDGEIDHAEPGVIDADWTTKRCLGTATASGDYADVGHSVWLSSFRQHLAPEALAAGFADFNAHALFATAPRSLTQHVSRMVFDNRLDGIRYSSKYGLEEECWALFEGRAAIADFEETQILVADPGLQSAMRTHSLIFFDEANPA